MLSVFVTNIWKPMLCFSLAYNEPPPKTRKPTETMRFLHYAFSMCSKLWFSWYPCKLATMVKKNGLILQKLEQYFNYFSFPTRRHNCVCNMHSHVTNEPPICIYIFCISVFLPYFVSGISFEEKIVKISSLRALCNEDLQTRKKSFFVMM